jgi:hypothetical protein
MNTRTLLHKLSLRRKLIYWIAGGFLLLFLVLELKQSACTSKELNIPGAANEEKGYVSYFYRLLPHWYCDESRFTDFLIAYFTYCLVVIGWFGIRSTEANSESLERAYIFHGYSPLEFRGSQAKFTLVMINSGRMPAVIKEIGYKFLTRADLPPTREGCDWTWDVLPYDFIVRPGQKADIRRFLSLNEDHIFVTYIKYQDVFTKKMHASWMGMHIYPDRLESQQIARAGGDIWNDWD